MMYILSLDIAEFIVELDGFVHCHIPVVEFQNDQLDLVEELLDHELESYPSLDPPLDPPPALASAVECNETNSTAEIHNWSNLIIY